MFLRIFETIATSGFLTAFECTKFVFGRGFAPDPTEGAYSAPRRSSWFKAFPVKGQGKGERKGSEQRI